MAENKKPISIDYDRVDNATDAEIEALVDQYSRGDEEAIKAVELYDEAAKKGDASALRLKKRFNKIAKSKNADFLKGIRDNDPEAVKNVQRIIKKYESGSLTPGEQQFILDYTTPAEEDIDRFLNEIIADPDARNKFLENLTPAKVKKLLPAYEMNPQKEEALVYTADEARTLRTGSDKEKALAKAARRKRAKSFLSNLTIGDFIAITKTVATRKSDKDDLENITTTRARDYQTTMDKLTRASFYNLRDEGERKGLPIRSEQSKPAQVELWASGKTGNKKHVVVYANLYVPDKEELEAAGIKIGRTLSIRARVMYGALLSLQLAGNEIVSIGMIGQIIFGVRDANDLTEGQIKYIEDGVRELSLIWILIDTRIKGDEKELYSLSETQGIEEHFNDYFYPIAMGTRYLNGKLVESAIILRDFPTLYRFQKKLEKPQILKVPMDLYSIPGRTDIDTVAIRQVLLDRIEDMKHGGSIKLIDYNFQILGALEIDPTDREQRTRKSRIRKKVERILDYWKQEDFIKDYEELAKNGAPAKGTAPIKNIKIVL